MNRFSKTLFAMLILTPIAAQAEEINGSYDAKLDQLYAVEQTGSRAPAGDSYCMDTFGKFVGTAISGTYAINTQTLIMSATATFEGQDVALFPLGLSSVYAFMSDGVPAPLADMQVHRIIFDLSHDQSTKESDVMFVAGGTYNCMLSNMAAI